VATAEVVSNAATVAITNAAVPLTSKMIQGSTQVFEVSTNSQRSSSPIFYAPSSGFGVLTDYSEQSSGTIFYGLSARSGQPADYSYWNDLFRGTVSGVYIFVPKTEATYPRKVSLAWDRLSLELMRVASLGPNWDGEGAEPVTPKSVSTFAVLLALARNAAQQSMNLECPIPTLFPSIDGGMILKWVRGPKELKCTVLDQAVEVIRWKSPDSYESDGLWEVPVQGVSEHFEWLLR
jgi:hypothetical protein